VSFDNSSARRPVSCFKRETDGEKKELERQMQRENTHHKPQGVVKTTKKERKTVRQSTPFPIVYI